MNLKDKITVLLLITLATAVVLTSVMLVDRRITSPGMIVREAPFPKEGFPAILSPLIPYATALTWGAFVFMLIWRGKVKHTWQNKGYEYDIFRLLTRMRGSHVRIAILRNVSPIPKNKHQLANELGMNWKSIDNHVTFLLNYNLVSEALMFGTSKYFAITDKGIEVLRLIDDSKNLSGTDETTEAESDFPK